MNAKLKQLFLDFLTSKINNLDYYDYDCFVEDNELSEDDIVELQELLFTLSVIEDNK